MTEKREKLFEEKIKITNLHKDENLNNTLVTALKKLQ